MLLLNFTLILFGGLTLPSVVLPVALKGSLAVKSYGFVHWETTGITSGIVVNRKQIPIQFAADSDALALRAFLALKWEVLAPNATGRSIIVVGQLGLEPKFTPKCDQCATSEEYREFKLADWYIVTPFKVVREDCGPRPYLRKENLQTKSGLELTDFHAFDGRNNMDVRRFQRRKKPNRRGGI
jgi:hypothetical protein